MFKFDILVEDFVGILTVVPKTLLLALVILLISTLLGGIIAIIQQYKIPIISQLITVFKSFLRGTPAVVLLYIMYYALPQISHLLLSLIGIEFNPNNLNPVITVIVTFSLTLSAFQSEIIRGAFLSVNYGQIEAAQSLGYNFLQTLWRVIVPQALTEALPDFLNSYMVIIKALSLAFLITVVDIFAKAKIVGAMTFRYLEAFVAAALIYWCISALLTYLVNRYEIRLRKGH
ncbi:amino acid ABC transporter permease [Fredinandcohnia salidurans]|uniref:Amino acid ABC transporter permease n=1 Tax=Fredinandcohnia salidurans TaxID=2595041 RepID=A0ABW4MNF4_9BACI|nr:amino acid ABC transporter permease [Fredinandcohnia onubensis]